MADHDFSSNQVSSDTKQKKVYENLISEFNIAMWQWDIKKGILRPFFGFETLLGYDNMCDLIHADFWQSIWHPDDHIQIKNDVRECVNHRCQTLSLIHRIKHHDGYYVWFYSKMKVNYTGDETSLIGLSINLDGLEENISGLQLEKENYENFLRATNAATWVWNVQTGETIFDEPWANLVGYHLYELAPIDINTWIRFVHPDDLEPTQRILDDVFNKKNEYYVSTFRMKHKDGHYVRISDRGKVITWTVDGKPLIMVGTHIDVTDHKRMESELIEREKHYKYLVENSYDIIYSLDLDGKMTYISPSWTRLLGHTVDETMHVSFRPFVHPDDLKRLEAFFERIYATKTHDAFEGYRLMTKSGEYRWFNTNASALTNDQGEVIGFTGTARDITGRKKLQDQLALERDFFKKTLLSVADAVISTDTDGKIVVINPQALKILGYKENDVLGKYLGEVTKIFIEDRMDGTTQSIENLILSPTERLIPQATLLNRLGKQILIELSIAPITDIKQTNEGSVLVFRDISEKIRKQKEIEFLSYHDFLTGLYNRRYMDQVIQDLDKDRYLPLGIMILDVNDLKEMNDFHGHQSGDELLKKISRILEQAIHPKDVLGRIGGDEFLIIVPNTTLEDMYRLKHSLIETFDHEVIKGRKISVALGYSVKTEHDQNIYDIMRDADNFMYAHKEARRQQE